MATHLCGKTLVRRPFATIFRLLVLFGRSQIPRRAVYASLLCKNMVNNTNASLSQSTCHPNTAQALLWTHTSIVSVYRPSTQAQGVTLSERDGNSPWTPSTSAVCICFLASLLSCFHCLFVCPLLLHHHRQQTLTTKPRPLFCSSLVTLTSSRLQT